MSQYLIFMDQFFEHLLKSVSEQEAFRKKSDTFNSQLFDEEKLAV